MAGEDFGVGRFFVEAAFAAGGEEGAWGLGPCGRAWGLAEGREVFMFPFEVFDGVGDVEEVAREADFLHDVVEELSGWADEGAAGGVFLVAGLFADDDEFGVSGAFAEDGLGGVATDVAGGAGGGGFAELGESQWSARWRKMGAGAPGGGGGFFDHLLHASRGGAEQFGDRGGFGKRSPVAGRHFLDHRADADACRIKNVFVVCFPEHFHGIFGHAMGFTGVVEEFAAGPGDGGVGGEDGPVHIVEAVDEEVGDEGKNAVVGPMKGDEMGSAVGVFDFTEADEGAGFVGVAADGFFHVGEGVDVVVDGDCEEMGFAVGEAVEGAVEEVPAARVAVAGDGFCEVEEVLGDAEGVLGA